MVMVKVKMLGFIYDSSSGMKVEHFTILISVMETTQQNILDYEPAEAVDIALRRLQKAGVELIEWGALLHRRMKVPVIVRVSLLFFPYTTFRIIFTRTIPFSFLAVIWTLPRRFFPR